MIYIDDKLSSIPDTVLSYPNGYINLGNPYDITKIYGDEIYLYAEEMNYGGVFTSSFINLTGNTFTINHSYDDTNNLGNSGGYSIWVNEITLTIANISYDFEGNCQFDNSITQDFNGTHIASRVYNDYSSINLGYNQNGIYGIDLNAPEVIVNGVLFSDLLNGSSGYVSTAQYAVSASYDFYANDLSTLFNGTGGNVAYSKYAGAADIANTANTDFNTAYISKINNAFIIAQEAPDLFNIYIEYDGMMKKMSKAEFKTWLNN